MTPLLREPSPGDLEQLCPMAFSVCLQRCLATTPIPLHSRCCSHQKVGFFLSYWIWAGPLTCFNGQNGNERDAIEVAGSKEALKLVCILLVS